MRRAGSQHFFMLMNRCCQLHITPSRLEAKTAPLRGPSCEASPVLRPRLHAPPPRQPPMLGVLQCVMRCEAAVCLALISSGWGELAVFPFIMLKHHCCQLHITPS